MHSFRIASLVTVLVATACGASSAELGRIRAIEYTCLYDDVYETARKIVADKAPPVGVANPIKGVVASEFRWHDQHGRRNTAGAAHIGAGDVAFSILVAIHKVNDRYTIKVVPRVLTQDIDSPRGEEISEDDGDWPMWASDRANTVLLAINAELKSCEHHPLP